MCRGERDSIKMLTEKMFYQCTIDERTKHRLTNPMISLPWAELMPSVVVVVIAFAAVVVVVMRVLGTLTVTSWTTAPIGVPSENATI